MNILIDIALVLIVLLFAWRGFRNGFIRGVFGVLAIIVAIYGANLVAKTYAEDFTGMLQPFVSGVVDKAYSDVMDGGEAEDNDKSDEAAAGTGDFIDTAESDTEDQKHNKVYDISYETLRKIGISEGASRQIAEKVGGRIDTIGHKMSTDLTDVLCDALAYIGVFTVVFILIAIFFAVIGNIINLAFSIPGLENVDRIIGLFMGILKGLLIVLALALVVRYLGLLAPDRIEQTTILKYILNMNPLADILGV
ncbi:MAG: CvpA family protein [Clostridiales bacterium]|nr:CvpA family protein [Clostridiales bacterium]